MTEHEALIKIQDLIKSYWRTDPIYYTNSTNLDEADVAKLCSQINEIIAMVEERK